MRIVTLEALVDAYEGDEDWETEYQIEREELIVRYPYSVVVEGAFLEYNSLKHWTDEQFGPENSPVWTSLWYGKTDYDYGYREYFFSRQADLQLLIQHIPLVHGIFAHGKKLRSEGSDRYIEVSDGIDEREE